MQVNHQRCAGIDIHKKMVVVMVLITQTNGQVQKFTRTFATMATDLLDLAGGKSTEGLTVFAFKDGILI